MKKAISVIDQPTVPENWYGMSLAVSNVFVGMFLYLGNNKNAEKLQITEITFHDEKTYLTVIDSNQKQFTLRYQTNARVQVANN